MTNSSQTREERIQTFYGHNYDSTRKHPTTEMPHNLAVSAFLNERVSSYLSDEQIVIRKITRST